MNVRHDPPQRRDGVCALPGCGNQRRRPARSHPAALEAWLRDPFCSTECAKAWYRVDFRDTGPGRYARAESAHDRRLEEQTA